MVASRGVILRSGADLESDIVGEVAQGALVEAVECEEVGERMRIRIIGDDCDGWATLKPTLMARASAAEPGAERLAPPPAPVREPRLAAAAPVVAEGTDPEGPCCAGELYPVHYPTGKAAVLGSLYELSGKRPRLPKSRKCWIAPGAHVIGDVVLGEDTSVWFNVVVRADNDTITIGDGTNVQDGSVVHADPGVPCSVGKHCTIGHKVTLHGCSVGDGSLIGMGAVVLNHAKIGKNCLVGAGSLVKEHATFPDNSLIIGSPAKLVRTLSDTQAAAISQGASGYVANSRKFKDTLVPVATDDCYAPESG